MAKEERNAEGVQGKSPTCDRYDREATWELAWVRVTKVDSFSAEFEIDERSGILCEKHKNETEASARQSDDIHLSLYSPGAVKGGRETARQQTSSPSI